MLGELLRVSVAVHDLHTAVDDYRALGLEPVGPVKRSRRGFGLEWVDLGGAGGPCIELIAPTGEDGPVARFLQRHGEGVYQVRLATESLAESIATLSARGVRVIGDPDPAAGARELAWIHPASTHGVLFELVEEAPR